MKRRTALLLALAVVLIIPALFLLAPGTPASTRQKIRLPDGNIVTLGKVTFSVGSRHDFSFDDSILARLGQKLPRFVRRYFPSSGKMSFQTESNSLVLWITMADGKTGAPLDFNSLLAADVADEHGCSSVSSTYASMNSGTNPAVYLVSFTRFPRRQATVRVRLCARKSAGGDATKPLAELDVPNPSHGKFPLWTPELPAIARTNGDLTFVLKHVGNPVEGPTGKRPQFDILRGGLPAVDWEFDALFLADATGNRGRDAFCTNEPAWKLEAEFLRKVNATFPPSEMFTVTNVTVPANGVAIRLTNSFTLHGKRFELCAIAGPGRYVYSNTVVAIAEPIVVGAFAEGQFPGPIAGQEEMSHNWNSYQGATPIYTLEVRRKKAHVALAVPRLAPEERLLLRVRGPDGVAHKLETSAGSQVLWLLSLSSVTNQGPFDLDIIVHRVRRAEFFVKPPDKW